MIKDGLSSTAGNTRHRACIVYATMCLSRPIDGKTRLRWIEPIYLPLYSRIVSQCFVAFVIPQDNLSTQFSHSISIFIFVRNSSLDIGAGFSRVAFYIDLAVPEPGFCTGLFRGAGVILRLKTRKYNPCVSGEPCSAFSSLDASGHSGGQL